MSVTKEQIKQDLTAYAKSKNLNQAEAIEQLISLLPNETNVLMEQVLPKAYKAWVALKVYEGMGFDEACSMLEGPDGLAYKDNMAYQAAMSAFSSIGRTVRRHFRKLDPLAKFYFLALASGDEIGELETELYKLPSITSGPDYDSIIDSVCKEFNLTPVNDRKAIRSGMWSKERDLNELHNLRTGISAEDYETLKNSYHKDTKTFLKVLRKYDRSVYAGDQVVADFKMTAINLLSDKGFVRGSISKENIPNQKYHFVTAAPTLKSKVTNWLKGLTYEYTFEVPDLSTAEDLNNQLNDLIRSTTSAEDLAKYPGLLTSNPFAMHL